MLNRLLLGVHLSNRQFTYLYLLTYFNYLKPVWPTNLEKLSCIQEDRRAVEEPPLPSSAGRLCLAASAYPAPTAQSSCDPPPTPCFAPMAASGRPPATLRLLSPEQHLRRPWPRREGCWLQLAVLAVPPQLADGSPAPVCCLGRG